MRKVMLTKEKLVFWNAKLSLQGYADPKLVDRKKLRSNSPWVISFGGRMTPTGMNGAMS